MKPGYKQTEVGVIPEEWETQTVIGLSRQIIDYRGRTPRKLGMEWGRGDIPALSAGNVKMGFIDFSQECYFASEALYKRWMTQGEAKKDDILFTTEAPLGNVALIPDDRKYILSQRTVLLQIDSGQACSRFLFQYMLSAQFQKTLGDYSSGSTAKGIQRKKLEQLLLPTPPLPEQRAIATALSDVDALLAALDRLIAKKRDLKQAAMQQLLTGQTRLPGFDGEWEVKRLGEVVSLRKERVDPRRSEVQDFCIELEHIESTTGNLLGSISTGEGASLKSVFRSGDVLFGKLRAYLKKYWLADRPGVCSTEIWVLAPQTPVVSSAFLFQLVKDDRFIEAASTTHGTHMPRSDWNVVKNYELRLPPLPEQTAIAAVLSDMDAELAALEHRRDKTRALKQGMMQELLTGRTRLA
jgi:type I restriction enzyme S subunit